MAPPPRRKVTGYLLIGLFFLVNGLLPGLAALNEFRKGDGGGGILLFSLPFLGLGIWSVRRAVQLRREEWVTERFWFHEQTAEEYHEDGRRYYRHYLWVTDEAGVRHRFQIDAPQPEWEPLREWWVKITYGSETRTLYALTPEERPPAPDSTSGPAGAQG